ncbi:Kdo hydroxylase family protein [Caballeronia sp. dw_19]|uniref:Kdo hydroxylase family protein n=1 Tax=Caballeronia sp. dw_19 TaxID=2719791 RepID=UPI001BD3AD28|nr:Kdo hydroxylase family protein [Caballeronia sp. dw_19]
MHPDLSQVVRLDGDWQARLSSDPVAFHSQCVHAIEQGKVLYFPDTGFDVTLSERSLLRPELANPARRNISLSADGTTLSGVLGDPTAKRCVQALIARYQTSARHLVESLVPEYKAHLRSQPTSLRLHPVEHRKRSWKADDSRLHVDAFPSRPNHGMRIVRVFANINPAGIPRVWRVGEPFEAVARRFITGIPPQRPGSAWLLEKLRITKSRRTPYDHLMLGLHDAMKADLSYQRDCAQELVTFQPGSTWICFSDQASHAVLSGQFMLEQTFFLPVTALIQPAYGPLAILERLAGQRLLPAARSRIP